MNAAHHTIPLNTHIMNFYATLLPLYQLHKARHSSTQPLSLGESEHTAVAEAYNFKHMWVHRQSGRFERLLHINISIFMTGVWLDLWWGSVLSPTLFFFFLTGSLWQAVTAYWVQCSGSAHIKVFTKIILSIQHVQHSPSTVLPVQSTDTWGVHGEKRKEFDGENAKEHVHDDTCLMIGGGGGPKCWRKLRWRWNIIILHSLLV